jgi:oxepin-CoA hydrolase/3-oxo-5,6-dehydrosuberyl-CoA semialdehyde dehydrogenase
VQEKKEGDDVKKGIVKWLVEVTDQTGEQVAIATILTMVRLRGEEEKEIKR